MSGFAAREFTAADAEQVARWRYGGAWAVYDRPAPAPLLRGQDGYVAVTGPADGEGPAGFLCTGGEARVPGQAAEPGVLDLGVGMAPALVGRGHGRAFGAAVLAHVRATAPPGTTRLRAVVQQWNVRSVRLARALGFAESGTHWCVQGGRDVGYVVLGMSVSGGTESS